MIKIEVEKSTRKVVLDRAIIGNDLENLQEELEFSFKDEFVNGAGRLDYELPNGDKGYIPLSKVDETYTIPLRNILMKEGVVHFQLIIIQAQLGEEIPVFKSNTFYFIVSHSINAEEEAPDDYETWIDLFEEKIAEVENLNINAERVEDGVEIIITDKQGEQHQIKVNDGEQGPQGENGVGIPSGGTSGQYLKKKSNTDFDTEWESLDNVFEEKSNKKQIINPVNTEYPSSYAVHNALNEKQNITDNTLVTSNKTIPTSINELKGRIDNLQNIGRFLAIWDCSTGLPTSEPSEIPYEYKTGDYFRVGVVDETTNYMPNGSSYNGIASTTEFTGTGLSLGAVFYYDGTIWRLQASGGGGAVQDVQVDGISVLVGGIAQIDLSNKQDVTLMINIIDEDNMIIDSTSSEIYDALINGRAVNLIGMNLSLVEYQDDDDNLVVSSYYGIGGYNFIIHENQIIDLTEVEFENLNNKEYTLSSSSDKYPSSSAVFNAISDKEIKSLNIIATITSLEPIRATFDKTFSEITQAYNQGKQVYLNVPAINNARFLMSVINNSFAVWQQVLIYNGQKAYLYVDIDSNNVVNITITPMASIDYVDEKIGDIETALGGI